MNNKKKIQAAYDLAADEYAQKYWDEIERKHFDRVILDWLSHQIPAGETVLEIGCGPGEVSGYLHRLGVQCLGTDFSPHMIEKARQYFPSVQFEVQDFFQLSYSKNTFGGVIGFYAIVNLALDEIKQVLSEVKRVLKENSLFLFTFHIFEIEEKTNVANFLVEGNQLTFYYFKVDDIKRLAEGVGFQIVDILIRHPYANIEYPSKRAYFILRK